jgi:hypothetical protein
MNERIRELALQAGLPEYITREVGPTVIQKFAELIVRECVEIAKHNIYEPDYRGGSQILESFENYQANRRAEDILNQIQKHFGD